MSTEDQNIKQSGPSKLQEKVHNIIFESNTPAGKAFDVALLFFILLSIIVVVLDSEASFRRKYGDIFIFLEWSFTIIFTLEYVLRLLTVKRPLKYAVSFLGVIDLLAIIPSYLSLIIAGSQSLLVLRALRLLRIFRIFKLTHFITEMRFLSTALSNSLRKISIFILFVLTAVVILGSIMYLLENGKNGFTSIAQCIYWAIVTITTVGYGDISPVTTAGKFLASIIMLLGYGIIAVPTGIVSTEMALAARNRAPGHEVCKNCGKEGHDADALFCKRCGEKL
ncbi:MAG: ion transporter [Segetibacter sp.]|nr:ion transporter [Segetibacter sp.]